jgi:hypothetical protein
MAFNHVTIGTTKSTNLVNVNYQLENVSLTSVGLSITRQAYGYPALSFSLGITPPGDEDVEVYLVLLSGLLSPGDGMSWSGSIRERSQFYLVLNYISDANLILILTYTTTG